MFTVQEEDEEEAVGTSAVAKMEGGGSVGRNHRMSLSRSMEAYKKSQKVDMSLYSNYHDMNNAHHPELVQRASLARSGSMATGSLLGGSSKNLRRGSTRSSLVGNTAAGNDRGNNPITTRGGKSVVRFSLFAGTVPATESDQNDSGPRVRGRSVVRNRGTLLVDIDGDDESHVDAANVSSGSASADDDKDDSKKAMVVFLGICKLETLHVMGIAADHAKLRSSSPVGGPLHHVHHHHHHHSNQVTTETTEGIPEMPTIRIDDEAVGRTTSGYARNPVAALIRDTLLPEVQATMVRNERRKFFWGNLVFYVQTDPTGKVAFVCMAATDVFPAVFAYQLLNELTEFCYYQDYPLAMMPRAPKKLRQKMVQLMTLYDDELDAFTRYQIYDHAHLLQQTAAVAVEISAKKSAEIYAEDWYQLYMDRIASELLKQDRQKEKSAWYRNRAFQTSFFIVIVIIIVVVIASLSEKRDIPAGGGFRLLLEQSSTNDESNLFPNGDPRDGESHGKGRSPLEMRSRSYEDSFPVQRIPTAADTKDTHHEEHINDFKEHYTLRKIVRNGTTSSLLPTGAPPRKMLPPAPSFGILKKVPENIQRVEVDAPAIL